MGKIDPKKLEAFAQKKGDKSGGFPPKEKAPPFGKKGKMGYKGKGGRDGEEEHEVDVQEIGERVQNGDGDRRLMRLSDGITEETNPPESITDEDIWEKAKEAVEPHWDEYDEPYAVVMHVYEKMGGGFAGGKGAEEEEPEHEDDDEDEEEYEDEE